jgi:hypothetical protein
VVLVMLATAAAACASGTANSGGSQPTGDRMLITRDQILQHRFSNIYDAVESLHSNWLRTKGTDSFSNPTEVLVYMDNVRVGGVSTLRTIQADGVLWVRYYDGIAATARWGMDHGQGVIFVSTRR